MGLISFIRDAGHKLFGGAPVPAAKMAAVTPTPVAVPVTPAIDPKVLDEQRAASIVDHVRKTGLSLDDLAVTVTGETATVTGRAKSQEMREKVILTVGNVLGIASVDDRIQVEVPEPEATYYTVKAGDTLSKVAKEVYGSANKYDAIFQANRPMLSHPDKIYPGQVLRIPPQAEKLPQA